MIAVNKVKILLMEETYPFFTDEELESMCEMYDDINELCYFACMMKADAQEITVGPISIKSNATMWRNLAKAFYRKWTLSTNGGRSITGCVGGRADE